MALIARAARRARGAAAGQTIFPEAGVTVSPRPGSTRLLRRANFVVDEAENGLQALKLLCGEKKGQHDVALHDLALTRQLARAGDDGV